MLVGNILNLDECKALFTPPLWLLGNFKALGNPGNAFQNAILWRNQPTAQAAASAAALSLPLVMEARYFLPAAVRTDPRQQMEAAGSYTGTSQKD